ncbi:hypothetical protein [Haladaptatus litoreus]|uniref:hypothetical protein n=1 Tax=Haladaptatus litoreus TaxID=553468 RepID=UPI00158BCCF6|nr:hypothetical protein [Haladaptatus litoreus]
MTGAYAFRLVGQPRWRAKANLRFARARDERSESVGEACGRVRGGSGLIGVGSS